jgi:hypothetical protein
MFHNLAIVVFLILIFVAAVWADIWPGGSTPETTRQSQLWQG